MISSKECKRRKKILFKELWKLLEETQHTYCFDCGERITPETASIFLDKYGVILYCPKHTWAKVAVRDFWNKF